MTYLQEAAEQLRTARDGNEKRRELAAELAAGNQPVQDILRETASRSMEIAAAFTRLAAIEARLPPCLGHDAREEKL
jgi:hypothetical protein